LSAIALPSYLNVAAKARQAEAKSYIGAINSAQNAYRIEHPEFATSISELQIGIPASTQNYSYSIPSTGAAQATVVAIPKDPTTLRSYTGKVAIVNGQSSTAICQSEEPSASAPTITLTVEGAVCADGSQNNLQ